MGEAYIIFQACLNYLKSNSLNAILQDTVVMPLLVVKTNLKAGDKAESLLLSLTDAIAYGTGKPKTYVSVILEDGKSMSFGGTMEPCAMIDLGSIGALEGRQKELTKAVQTVLKDQLGISPARSYMFFNDIAPKNVGHNNSTFG